MRQRENAWRHESSPTSHGGSLSTLLCSQGLWSHHQGGVKQRIVAARRGKGGWLVFYTWRGLRTHVFPATGEPPSLPTDTAAEIRHRDLTRRPGETEGRHQWEGLQSSDRTQQGRSPRTSTCGKAPWWPMVGSPPTMDPSGILPHSAGRRYTPRLFLVFVSNGRFPWLTGVD